MSKQPVKYGLEIRRPPGKTAAASRPAARPSAVVPSIFGDDEDEGVEAEIARQNTKKRTEKQVSYSRMALEKAMHPGST